MASTIKVSVHRPDADEIRGRRVPSELGDFSVLDIGDLTIYIMGHPTLDALQAALDTIRAEMDGETAPTREAVGV